MARVDLTTADVAEFAQTSDPEARKHVTELCGLIELLDGAYAAVGINAPEVDRLNAARELARFFGALRSFEWKPLDTLC
ncbi:hypothetical protein [Rhodococcus sp. NPDC049939]|uniref:hypothetical protein n=1 Tax=Rhodococcus sp. NPDC049939 TaxID=3155511 RepID=UPI0033E3F29E